MPPPASESLVRAYVGLGANLGDLALTLDQALGDLGRLPQTRLTAISSGYRSAPIEAGGPDFLNKVAALDTALSPKELLAALQRIELAHGRERPYRNAPRTLDLDLLAYGDHTQATQDLTLPHPRLHQRAFVLHPLLELTPDLALPGLGSLAGYLPQVADQTIERS